MIGGLQADAWSIARPLVLLIVLPLVIGMLTRARFSSLAVRAASILMKVGTAFLFLLFVLLIAIDVGGLLGVVGSGAIAAVALYVIELFAVGWIFGGSKLEVSSQKARRARIG